MRWFLPILAFAGAAPAAAEVTSQGESGFATAGSVTVAVTPGEAWAALIEPKLWWNPEHSWSGDGANLSLDPHAGGCFCEALADGGSVEHMRVIHAAPGKQLRMAGALGPLQGEALAATLSVTLEPEGEGTKIAWAYKVGGYTDLPIEQIAPAVDAVISQQFHRLAAHLGSRTAAPAD
jgi:carbon monoxide dehydrogenase subunit G